MNRVTDLASQNLTLSFMRDAQARVAKGQIQLTSGKTADRYAGIARDAGRVVSLEADAVRAKQFVAGNKIVDLRLQRMENNVAAIMDVASRARVLLVSASSDPNAGPLAASLGQNAAHMLEEVASLLNDRLDGRHLFAGSRTDTPPVDLAALPADGVFAGDPAGYYYRGGGDRLAVRAAEDLELTYGIGADEAGFGQLIQALQLVKIADSGDAAAARARLDRALELVNKAVAELPEIRSRIGTTRASLEAVNQKHEDFTLYAEQAVGDVQNIDVPETVTRLSGDQMALEASYAALARLRSVSLLDYLR